MGTAGAHDAEVQVAQLAARSRLAAGRVRRTTSNRESSAWRAIGTACSSQAGPGGSPSGSGTSG